MEFNLRVLSESLNPKIPLMERLKFLSIYFSNLDEFFMVRVGSLHDQSIVEPDKLDDKTGLNAADQIKQTRLTLSHKRHGNLFVWNCAIRILISSIFIT